MIHILGQNKKLDTANHFGHVFTNFQKSIRAWWGLTFSITEFCFGDHFINFNPIGLIFVRKLHLRHSWGQKKIGSAIHFGQVFTNFQKVPALNDA